MASSETQQKTIALGKQLVLILSRDQRADRLSQWMAQYIAEQMVVAANAQGAEKLMADEKCCNTILQIWERRGSFPNGLRPFELFEPVIRALESLDPENPRSFYHDFLEPKGKPARGSVEEMTMQVIALDRAARVILGIIVDEAVERATDDETREFLRNAVPHAAGPDITTILQLRQRLENQTPSEDAAKQEAAKRLRDRIERLDQFIELAQSFRVSLADSLKTKND